MNDNIVLNVHDLTVAYDHKPVLWDIDFPAPLGPTIAVSVPLGIVKSISHNTGL